MAEDTDAIEFDDTFDGVNAWRAVQGKEPLPRALWNDLTNWLGIDDDDKEDA